MPTVLLRKVPDTFDRAIVPEGGRAPDVGLAREQHERYRLAFEDEDYTVWVMEADDTHPDCVFIEDTAVIVRSVAVAARPGVSARRGEVGPVAAVLARTFPMARIEAPGTLDGGDVMIMGERVFVGRSDRTNDDGISQFEAIVKTQGMSFTPVPVNGVLHLKSAVLPVDEETVVVTPGTVDESLLSDLRIVHEAPHEQHAFSALRMRTGRVLVTDNAPDTAGELDGLGIAVVPIDISEIQAANGGLTCLSILLDD